MSRFDPTLPLERAHTLPAGWYTERSVHDAEGERVFARSWQCVGRAEQVAAPGAFLTAAIAGEPVLVVRGDDGEIRAFFNVCRHRAAPLLTAPTGCVGKLRCPYHGWTYDLAGALKGTPEFDGARAFDKADNGLVALGGVEIAGPFVWVQVLPPARPVTSVFAPLFERSNLDGLKHHSSRSYVLNCNWKVYVDNYLDGGYHVNTVHPALAGVIDYRRYRTEVFERCSVQTSPLTPAAGAVGATRTGDAAYWWLYPNFMVNSSAGVMDTNRVLPLEEERCEVTFDFYFAADAPADFIRDSLAVAHAVQEEDVAICERVQRGLRSRSFETGRFSPKREAGGYHFHRLLAADVPPPAG